MNWECEKKDLYCINLYVQLRNEEKCNKKYDLAILYKSLHSLEMVVACVSWRCT